MQYVKKIIDRTAGYIDMRSISKNNRPSSVRSNRGNTAVESGTTQAVSHAKYFLVISSLCPSCSLASRVFDIGFTAFRHHLCRYDEISEFSPEIVKAPDSRLLSNRGLCGCHGILFLVSVATFVHAWRDLRSVMIVQGRPAVCRPPLHMLFYFPTG